MSGGKFEELMQSPYDDEPDDPSGAIPWKLPVGAAILGALLMAAYVIAAVVTGPTEEAEPGTTDAVGQIAPDVSTDFPPGFAAVSPDVAFSADFMIADKGATTLLVSSVSRVGSDPRSLAPVDVATWTLLSPSGEESMVAQYSSREAPGGFTVQFGPVSAPDGAVAVAALPGAVAELETTVDTALPTRLVDYELAGDGFVVVIDELEIGINGGSFRWHLEGGVAAKVDIVITLAGAGLVPQFVTPYNAENEQGVTVAPEPLWAPVGRSQLIGDFDPHSEGGSVPTSATIEFFVLVVTEIGESFEIPIGTVVGP
ncbi:MAG: hypothetical protein BMS9Abin12_1607 [Acidimicrobiia bacterium]|nr:MAG: hypothetical protein BMS9Abin12_1607 [Acidimicrobiia bacterium]